MSVFVFVFVFVFLFLFLFLFLLVFLYIVCCVLCVVCCVFLFLFLVLCCVVVLLCWCVVVLMCCCVVVLLCCCLVVLCAGCCVVACWLLRVGGWLLVVGCWLLVVGCWLLVVGCWLLWVCLCLFGWSVSVLGVCSSAVWESAKSQRTRDNPYNHNYFPEAVAGLRVSVLLNLGVSYNPLEGNGSSTGFSVCYAYDDKLSKPLPFYEVLSYLYWSGKKLALAATDEADISKLSSMRDYISEHWHPDMWLVNIPCVNLEKPVFSLSDLQNGGHHSGPVNCFFHRWSWQAVTFSQHACPSPSLSLGGWATPQELLFGNNSLAPCRDLGTHSKSVPSHHSPISTSYQNKRQGQVCHICVLVSRYLDVLQGLCVGWFFAEANCSQMGCRTR